VGRFASAGMVSGAGCGAGNDLPRLGRPVVCAWMLPLTSHGRRKRTRTRGLYSTRRPTKTWCWSRDPEAADSCRRLAPLVKASGADTGIPKSEVSRTCSDLDQEVGAFRDRSLAGQHFPHVFLDATYCKARVNRRVDAVPSSAAWSGLRGGPGRVWRERSLRGHRRRFELGRGLCPLWFGLPRWWGLTTIASARRRMRSRGSVGKRSARRRGRCRRQAAG
jgi:hypothetical protein